MKKLAIAVAAGCAAVAAVSLAPAASAADTANPTTIVVTLTQSTVLGLDGIPAAKKECATEAGPDAGLTLKDKIVVTDHKGNKLGEGTFTKVSLRPNQGEVATFFNCQFSGKLEIMPAKVYTITLGKNDPIKVTNADLVKSDYFLKLQLP